MFGGRKRPRRPFSAGMFRIIADMPSIHPSSTVSRESLLAEECEVGPFCVLSGRVLLARGVKLHGNVYIQGPAEVGEGTEIYPFTCVGFPGQDVKFKPGMPTAGVSIGKRCILREHVTIHAATKTEAPTSVGDEAFLMVNTHLGHDARIGEGVTMVNNSALGGHARVGDRAILGGGALIHQFGRIGRLAFVGGHVPLSADLPPFCITRQRNTVSGLNLIGMRRSGMNRDDITTIRRAFRQAFARGNTRSEMVAILEEIGKSCAPVMEMARFVAETKRTICARPRPRVEEPPLDLDEV